jgi:hypothetical protein
MVLPTVEQIKSVSEIMLPVTDPIKELILTDEQIIDSFLNVFINNYDEIAKELSRCSAEKVGLEIVKIFSSLKRESMLNSCGISVI